MTGRHLLLSLLAAAAAAQTPLPQRYRDAGVLRWGADKEGGEPFVYDDPSRPGTEIGFEVELAAELGRVLGVRTEHVQTAFESLVLGLDRGDFDFVLNGFEPLPARRAEVRFTRPYYIFQQQLSVAKTTTGVTSLADLAGRKVGVLGQTSSWQVVHDAPGVEVVVYESNVLAYQTVADGRIAASLADVPIARAQAPRFPGLVDAGPPFGEFYYALAVRKQEPELQRALDGAIDALLKDGSLERIYRKWHLWEPQEQRLGEPQLAAMFAGDFAASEIAWGSVLALLLHGALVTLAISVAAFLLAMLLGLGIALLRIYGGATLRWVAVSYVELFRGTPVLVQLLVLYYGIGQFHLLRIGSFQLFSDVPAVVFGGLGLALNYAAYESEIYRGALAAIPRGQREAAQALGLTTWQTLRHVLIPQSLRLSLAPSTNDFIALFKDSSIVSVISVVELTKQYQFQMNATNRFIALGIVTSGLYLAMSLPLAVLARRFERALERDGA